MELLHRGKVREVYADGDDVILVASDRVSVYDVILPTPIPDKGAVLTQLSLWWFKQLGDLVPNHVISEDVPAEWAGRAVRCKRVQIVPVECIVRGYLAGHGLESYRESGTVSGIAFPPGLVEGSRLPEPVYTPSTKAEIGEHDELVTVDDVRTLVGPERTEELERLTLAIYGRGSEIARDRGVIVADTKVEFGTDADGTLLLADEVLTPDSSRFWLADEWKPGGPQNAFDKQVVRDWSSTVTDWDRTAPGPAIPDDVVRDTRQRYVDIYERITGERWSS
ncbi:phosphoribosylaminoimidazolesuccinocarboxamide synthase [Luteipulveratus mongoliensis]|uniref:Phosphoribosylaminoimidazole-succinocarboxamide synthase n=1 Tax=Luteipulveratus mongoliensis TaxID=571913 RepID=A0A0K1JG69_9MICO|nr:phosphoribosylaminoimidazolesuccinocarboxamide synthase [Luteipulveratus mongoliensis]AKU15593.1 phosphoribosylaminoimidazole-succinocarboxamide synthase [Luteipulveratus mongoliensis]